MVDNFDLIKKIINENPPNVGEFYFVQIFVRRKDGHTAPGINGNNKNRQVKIYVVKSAEYLEEKKSEIIGICNLLNARAYIHLSKRSFREVGNKMLELFATTFLSNPEGLNRLYATACGQSYISGDKKLLVDLDGEDSERKEEIIEFINTNCEPYTGDKHLYTIPTVHGKHLIMKPFNVKKFKDAYPNIDVHKNNPTLLYYNPQNKFAY